MGKSLIDRVRDRWCFAVFVLLTSTYSLALSSASAEERRIELYNIHTKDNISIVFKRDGKFIPEALKKLNKFMRDWRRDAVTEMDPELFDIIWDIHRELGSKKPVHIISGYRSPKTNAMLRRTRGGQAKKSKHMTGQAADIHFPDVSIKQLRNSALIREKGGVGYYPTSAIPFVHVDTGRVRHWPRLPRQELAILFPSGHSRHIPTDGRPLTKKDFRVALAKLQQRGGELPIAVQHRLQGNGEGRTILASLSPDLGLDVPVPTQAPEDQPVPAAPAKFVLASLTPFDSLVGSAVREPETERPLVKASLPPSVKAGGDLISRDFLQNDPVSPSDTVPQDQMASAPEYDDDHPDELYYQPFPILPFMADVPVASIDLTDGATALALPKVHMFFGESRRMLMTEFKPGLQYAQLFWAQRFRGTAVNSAIQELVRDDTPQPIQTARR